jgi:hypothetical protein
MLTLNDMVWIRVKAAFLRITLTKVSAAFFLFGFVHCFAQGILQSFLFTYDNQYSSFVGDILHTAKLDNHSNFAWLIQSKDTFDLKICDDIPHAGIADPCMDVFSTSQGNSGSQELKPVNDTIQNLIRLPSRSSSAAEMDEMSSNMPMTALYNDTGGIAGVALKRTDGSELDLSLQCAEVLLYPYQVLSKNKREDLVFIAVQFWLFAISFIAIMYDSIPHTLAVLIARVLLTSWSAYIIWRTGDIRNRFFNLVMKPESPCHVDMFNPYFATRLNLEIADLVLNLTALVLSGSLGWNLLKMYGAQVFKRAGPPLSIVRIYGYFLTVHVSLLLSLFTLVTAMALWIDQLMNNPGGGTSQHTALFQALFISTTCLLPFWILMGYLAVRRERKRVMTLFLILTSVFIIAWSVMFYSRLYRWMLFDWPLFATATIMSYFYMIITMAFGVLSLINFGRGLATYMNVEDDLQKVDFNHDIFPIKEADTESVMGSEKEPNQSTISLHVPTLHSDQEKIAKNWF